MKRTILFLLVCFPLLVIYGKKANVKENIADHIQYMLDERQFVNYQKAVLFFAPANDDCTDAISLMVNPDLDCGQKLSVDFTGATASGKAVPFCSAVGSSPKDLWFEFTATSDKHILSISSEKNMPATLYGALYDRDCSAINATASQCFSLTAAVKKITLDKLKPGKKYYIRLMSGETTPTTTLVLCLGTVPPPIKVSPSGEMYTVEELVKDVLVKSGCDLVSNVRYQVQDGSPQYNTYNTLGYFHKNGSDFPYEEGIVLATGSARYIAGPYDGGGGVREKVFPLWNGDPDLNAVIDSVGGRTGGKFITQLFFDFIPVKDSLKFEYLFASESWQQGCWGHCEGAALFAAWLTDTTTGIGENLAVIPGTTTPIALNTIMDLSKSNVTGIGCQNINEEYFWKAYNGNGVDAPFASAAPINYASMTTAMQSETVKVIPGRKYRIRLAVMDFCTTPSHTSAVFFNARSFDLGNPEIGEDMSIEGGNALCPGDTIELGQNLEAKDYLIQWTKNGKDLIGENGETLKVSEPGLYGARLKYKYVVCDVELDPVKVEFYDEIIIEKQPSDIEQCRSSTSATTIN
ncbi:choice-of-anchor L domain-containing protein, partial [Myroides indicus]